MKKLLRRCIHRFDWSGIPFVLVATVLGLIMAIPLIYQVLTSFKPLNELFIYPPRFFVIRPTLQNYFDLFLLTYTDTVPVLRYLFNSVLVTTVTVVSVVLICGMAAFAITKFKAPGRHFFFQMVVAALMFSPVVTQIPRFVLMNQMGLIDTYWALILPVVAFPLGMFLMTQFMEQVPDALVEAAHIDGASHWTTFIRVVMPMCQPAWATLSIFAFQASWNDLGAPTLFLYNEALKTLPVWFSTIGSGVTIARMGVVAAGLVAMMVPNIVLFLALQKKVIQTMAHSGIK